MKKTLLYIILVVVFGSILLFFPKRVIKNAYLFDTFVYVEIYTPFPWKAYRAIDDVFSEMKSIDTLDAPYIKSGVHPDDVIYLIKRGIDVGYETDGAFDISVGRLMKVWKRFTTPFLPSSDSIKKALNTVGYKRIKIKSDTLILPKGMLIDLGGIAKGYAIDRAVQILKERGFTSGLVYAGGDLGIVGPKPFHRKWKIGIKNPRGDGVVASTEMDAGFIATSGDYERYFILDGKRYCHILNPYTGYPARGIISSTVIAPTGLLSDAYATAVFVMGKSGIHFLKNHHLEGLLIFEEGDTLRCIKTEGFKTKEMEIDCGR